MLDRTPSYDDADRSALERSMEIAQRDDPGRADQLAAMLRDEAWHSVAKFASYCCQKRSLGLKPWEDPPLCAPPGTPGARLLDRMLAANISQFEPDPLGALALANPPAPIKAPTAVAATCRKAKQCRRERQGLVTLQVTVDEMRLIEALVAARLLDPMVDHDKVEIEGAVVRLLELIMSR